MVLIARLPEIVQYPRILIIVSLTMHYSQAQIFNWKPQLNLDFMRKLPSQVFVFFYCFAITLCSEHLGCGRGHSLVWLGYKS
jgi:hypothetical protein